MFFITNLISPEKVAIKDFNVVKMNPCPEEEADRESPTIQVDRGNNNNNDNRTQDAFSKDNSDNNNRRSLVFDYEFSRESVEMETLSSGRGGGSGCHDSPENSNHDYLKGWNTRTSTITSTSSSSSLLHRSNGPELVGTRTLVQKPGCAIGETIDFFPLTASSSSSSSSSKSTSKENGPCISIGGMEGPGELQFRSSNVLTVNSDAEETNGMHAEGQFRGQIAPTTSTMRLNGNQNSGDKAELEKRKGRRNTKREQQRKRMQEWKSQDIPQHKGDLSIDELLAFIDNTEVQKPTTTTAVTQHQQTTQKSTMWKKDDCGKSNNSNNKSKFSDCIISPTTCYPGPSPASNSNNNNNSSSSSNNGTQERTSLPAILDDSTKTERRQQWRKKKHESLDAPVVMATGDDASLPTSSSTSSFRTASPPSSDVPPPSRPEKFYPEPPQQQPAHSPTVHREFITVQKKKKVKQIHQHGSHHHHQQTTTTHKSGVLSDGDVVSRPTDSGKTFASKSFFGGGRQATSTRTFYGISAPAGGVKCFVDWKSDPNNNNNNNFSGKNHSSRSPFSDKKATPIVDDPVEVAAPKAESQFDPSQFPELSGNARRNSTGSSETKNSDRAGKGFTFSYADIAAKLKQKKHSSDSHRRGSLQLTGDAAAAVESTSDQNVLESNNNDDDRKGPMSGALDDSSLMELADSRAEGRPGSEVAPAEASDVSSNCTVVEMPLGGVESLTSRPSNPRRCKEPVVFLDGRKNAKVTDLVFIFDPSLPANKKTHPALTERQDLSGALSTQRCPGEETTRIARDEGASGSAGVDSDSSDFAGSNRVPSESPINVSFGQQNSRPSPLSNSHPASRQVVKVSPMPIVPPEASADRVEKNLEATAATSTAIDDIGGGGGGEAKLSIDIGFLSPPMDDPRLLVAKGTTTTRRRNAFDLCKAQMFLYAGFEECIKESKNNPTNVVVYSE